MTGADLKPAFGPVRCLPLLALLGVLTACSRPAQGEDKKEPRETGRMTAAGPVGLFFMTRYNSSLHSLEKAAWLFQDDGAVYENLTAGLTAADLKAHAGPRGKYQFGDHKMKITWSDGTAEESNVERDGTSPGFMWDLGIFSPVSPLQAADVAGTYDGGETLTQLGPDSAVFTGQEFIFRPDGTYLRNAVANLQNAGGGGSDEGTWKTDGFSLTLTSNKGKTMRKLTLPVTIDEKSKQPDHLYLGGLLLKRRVGKGR
ncbi:MAG TPA: hypothetical protein VFE24_13765 [Pirellulales bacterium]|jgi:hypothetical protein|nr:hypothetical protein [Pirellulales bacterium]